MPIVSSAPLTTHLFAATRLSRSLSSMDHLTNCQSRTSVSQLWLDEMLARISGPTSLVSVDVDALKQYIEFFGIPAGDVKLVDVANAFRAAFPICDIVRTGGDEFFTVCGTDSPELSNIGTLISGLAAETVVQNIAPPPNDPFVRLWQWATGKEPEQLPPDVHLFSVSCRVTKIDPATTISELLALHDCAISVLTKERRTYGEPIRRAMLLHAG